MPNRSNSGLAGIAIMLLAFGCAEPPTATRVSALEPMPARQPPPPPLTDLAPIDLGQGVVGNHWAYGVNDSGWVFGMNGFMNLGGTGVVWLTHAPNDPTDSLPAQVVNPGQGNGRGDYIAYWEDAVMLRGANGWTLSQSLHAPAGWPDTVSLDAMNDARLIVGWAKDPNRCTTTTQGGTTSTYCEQGPVAWVNDPLAGSWTPVAMSIPAPSDPASCRVRGVIPTGVNDAGMVVGYAKEVSLKGRGGGCPSRAIVWPTVSGPAVALPRSGTLSGYSYQPEDINDRGDITGIVASGSDYRAVRWRAGAGTAEVLNGYYAFGEAIDDCGRVVTSQGHLWEVDGSVVVRLQAPTGFTALKVRDFANGLAVGEANHSTFGWHALVWTLNACTPAP